MHQGNLAVVLGEKKKTINIHCGPETHGRFHSGKMKSFTQEVAVARESGCENHRGPLVRKREYRAGSAEVESCDQTLPPRREPGSAASCDLCVWMQARERGEGTSPFLMMFCAPDTQSFSIHSLHLGHRAVLRRYYFYFTGKKNKTKIQLIQGDTTS